MVDKFFHFFCAVCEVKGFEDGFSDNSHLLFFGQETVFGEESALASNNPTYNNLL
jgi:hypothetical protein